MIGQKHVLSREGGVEIVVRELSTRMAALGYDVTCFDRSGDHICGDALDNRKEYNGIKIKPVWTINKKGLAAMSSSLSASLIAALSDFDVVHIHAEGPAAMSWLPKITNKKVIVTIHGLDWARSKWGGFATKYIKFGESEAAKKADEIIVLSKNIQDYFKTTYNRDTKFIPNGVNAPIPCDANQISKLWGLEKDNYVLYLGRIVPEKGLKCLIEAWKTVQTEKKLVIAGGSSDTDAFFSELKSLAPSNVIFTGFQQGPILEELFSNAYIYTLPSDLEGMPLSLLEAMSYGNCCLVSDIDECTEVVEDKAVTFPKGNVNELSHVLQKLLDNPLTVQEYKNCAAKFITQKYDWDVVVKETLKLYEE